MEQKKIMKQLSKLNQKLQVNLFEPNEILKAKLANILKDIHQEGILILKEALLDDT